MQTSTDTSWPRIRTAGFDGFLVSFGDRLSEPANRAALAFRDAVDRAGWDEVQETSTSLVSAYLRFDPLAQDHAQVHSWLAALLEDTDWYDAPLPEGRRLWRVPTVFGTDLAPQLEEVADLAGHSPEAAIEAISQTRVRVQTIGFAPGMPYLGELGEEWDIPRQTGLTARVPEAGLCVAIRQLVLFPVATPTGWRQIGQTAFRLFRPESDTPFVLRPGDEVLFQPVERDALDSLRVEADGGAVSEAIE
ncbi:sensor histidine kinase inhibitor, KipI family [Cribrihabitans marinus]|uniref:Sensor histidine kinase inhibitor, KipI family n=1 Tax=Cribrihabitans marinus TaxID=1227549 RepID=A0A1H6Z5I9_9RHOB|nr:allophanate hydrolase subunit 1 [Cribrihabitans marinus]GGH31411.1 allophanate hydrolase [Cribrihabitans marinus]SEJ47976.1 sensor histidine kinase inhibitor, KipI family [Cribrihabitans marinus]